MSPNLNNASFDEQHAFQSLLNQKARIEAQLASFMPSSAPASTSRHGQSSGHRDPRKVIPRSYSGAGTSMSRTISGQGHREAVPMSASLSQRSAPTMTRTGSKGTSSSSSSIPFTNTGQMPPPLQTIDSRQDASVLESWATRHDDPVTTYTFTHQGLRPRSGSQRKPELEQVAEIDSGLEPTEYFAIMPILSVTSSPIDTSAGGSWRSPNHHRGSMSSRRRPSFGIPTPTTPSTAALTTGTTFASDMSRQNSFCNEAIVGGFEMMNVHSNNSNFTDNNSADEYPYHSGIPFHASSHPKLISSSEEQNLLLAGACGASHDSQFSLSFQDSRASTAQFQSQALFMEDMQNMQRSQSNESNGSTSSSKSRSVAQLQRQNQLGTRRLAPKAGSDGVAMSRDVSQQKMVSIKSKDGSEDRVVAISKTPYQRPKHDRVFCDLCTDHREGFRGAHELGRHQDRQHPKDQVKKWICVEPIDGIISPQYQPVNFLSNCKSCSQQKKYGAYYNAAAHLRRAHFRPKGARGRGNRAKVDEKSEKRGGKAGGDWPPMTELKRWMREHVTENQQQEANDGEEDDDDCSGYDFESDMKLQSMSTAPVTSQSLRDELFFADSSMVDAYPTPVSSFTTEVMQNMQFDNLPPSIDLTVRIDSSQSSFVDSHFASMNDHMTFIDPFPQNFEDQSLGQDLFNLQFQM